MQNFEVGKTSCWYCGKQGHIKRNCWSFKKVERQLKDEDTDSIIKEFLANLDSVESKIVQVKAKTKCHAHWWDGWKNEEKSVEEEECTPSKTQIEYVVDFSSQGEEDADWSEGAEKWSPKVIEASEGFADGVALCQVASERPLHIAGVRNVLQ